MRGAEPFPPHLPQESRPRLWDQGPKDQGPGLSTQDLDPIPPFGPVHLKASSLSSSVLIRYALIGIPRLG